MFYSILDRAYGFSYPNYNYLAFNRLGNSTDNRSSRLGDSTDLADNRFSRLGNSTDLADNRFSRLGNSTD